jgi:hypothetical protein
MSENSEKTICNPFDYLATAFLASLPEESANDLIDFKKRVLNGIKSTVDSVVDHEVNASDQRLENARRMREEWRQQTAEGDGEAPPNPA